MSDAAADYGARPRGTSLLARSLTNAELDAAPTLESIEALLIDDMSDDENDAFAAALDQ